jgi:hypothetical protein
MIAQTLTTLAALPDDYLKRAFRLNEEIVCMQPVANTGKSAPMNYELFNIDNDE